MCVVFLEHSCDKMELPSWLERQLKTEWMKQQVILRNEDLQRKYRRVKFTGNFIFLPRPLWLTVPGFIFHYKVVSDSIDRHLAPEIYLHVCRSLVSPSEYTVDLLHAFTRCSGLDLVFGLNALLRTADNTWNSSNARSLLQYCEVQQYKMSWELGNGTAPHCYHL